MPLGKEARICAMARSSNTVIACLRLRSRSGSVAAPWHSGYHLARCDLMRMFLERRDVAFLFGRGAEGRPRCHESPAAVEQVGAVVGGDRLVVDSMRERHLGNL